MRFLPLLPSGQDPAPWGQAAPVMLQWTGDLHPDWRRAGGAVHGVHLPGDAPLEEALAVLAAGLEVDFLVLPVAEPRGREAGFRLLGQVEAILEAAAGRGVKLALRLAPGAVAPVLELLREARGEAVGWCWHPGLPDPEPLADRLWTAVGAPGADLAALQATGYRWDVALAAPDPATFRAWAEALAAAHPAVVFPAQMPRTVLGRPVVPDDSLTFGRHWFPGGRP